MGKRSLGLYGNVLIIAVLPLLLGCLGGPPPAALHHFLIEYPPPASRGATCSHQTVTLHEFATARAYNSTSMAYSSGAFKRDSYVYSRWRVTPGEMISDYLLRDLRRAGIFGTVFSSRDGGNGRYSLEGTVDEFLESDQGKEARAVLAATVTLLDTETTDATRLVAFQKSYRIAESMTGKSPEALAEAMSKATARFSGDLIGDLCEALAAKGEGR